MAAKALLKDLNAKHGLATVLLEFLVGTLSVIAGPLESVLSFCELCIFLVEAFLKKSSMSPKVA